MTGLLEISEKEFLVNHCLCDRCSSSPKCLPSCCYEGESLKILINFYFCWKSDKRVVISEKTSTIQTLAVIFTCCGECCGCWATFCWLEAFGEVEICPCWLLVLGLTLLASIVTCDVPVGGFCSVTVGCRRDNATTGLTCWNLMFAVGIPRDVGVTNWKLEEKCH